MANLVREKIETLEDCMEEEEARQQLFALGWGKRKEDHKRQGKKLGRKKYDIVDRIELDLSSWPFFSSRFLE